MPRKRVQPTKEDLDKLQRNPFVNDEFQIRVHKRTDPNAYIKEEGNFINKTYYLEIDKPTKVYLTPDARLTVALLSASSKSLLLWILYEMKPGKDYVVINKQRYMKEHQHKTEMPLKEGLFELSRYCFITPTFLLNVFWINPKYFFNGSRLKKYPEKKKVIHDDQP